MPGVAAGYIARINNPFGEGPNTSKQLGITDGPTEFETALAGRDITGYGGATVLDTVHRGMNVFLNFTAVEVDLSTVQLLLGLYARDNSSSPWTYHPGHEGLVGQSLITGAIEMDFVYVEAGNANAAKMPPQIRVHRCHLAVDTPTRLALQEDLMTVPFRMRVYPVCENDPSVNPNSGIGRGRRFYTWLNKEIGPGVTPGAGDYWVVGPPPGGNPRDPTFNPFDNGACVQVQP